MLMWRARSEVASCATKCVGRTGVPCPQNPYEIIKMMETMDDKALEEITPHDGSIKEPLPGWIEGVNGPTGLMIGAARGVIRSMHCNPDYSSTIIPVDKAINGMIVAGYY
ncbi:Fatty acyl-CoA reductase 2, partial [Eumeta japonica]